MFCLLGGKSIADNLYRPKKISRHKFLARCRTVPTHMSHAVHFWQTGSWTIRTTTNKCIFPVGFTSLTQTKSWYFHHPSALLTDWQWNYLHFYKLARKSRFYLHRRGRDTHDKVHFSCCQLWGLPSWHTTSSRSFCHLYRTTWHKTKIWCLYLLNRSTTGEVTGVDEDIARWNLHLDRNKNVRMILASEEKI